MVLIAEVAYQLRQRREEAQRIQVHRAQRKDGAAEVDDGGIEHGLQLIQRGAHAGGSRLRQVMPQRRFEAESGQALRHTVVDLVGDAMAFGVDGFRLAPALHLGRDIFHRDDHVAGVGRIGRGDDAHGKARAVPALVRGLRRHRLALLDPLHDGQDGWPGFFGYQVGSRHACELGGRVAVDQLRPPVGLQDDRRGRGQVGDEDADGHVLEQVAVPLLAGTARALRLAGHHMCGPRYRKRSVTLNL